MAAGPDPRRIALEGLRRVDDDGGFANLVVPAMLTHTDLDARDRGLVTELVYGITRMRRACDYLVDRFLNRPPPPDVRRVLRLGAYQLAYLGTPPHAAVATSVALAPDRFRGLVNAVLRRVARDPQPAVDEWPDVATRLSYPDWIVERLSHDLGADNAVAALERMNERAAVTERADGYVQDAASQWVAAVVGAESGQRIADVCAAPGGKATALAAAGAWVAASDIRVGRTGLIASNVERLGLVPNAAPTPAPTGPPHPPLRTGGGYGRHTPMSTAGSVSVVVADGCQPPYRPHTFDRVLVDAPCSGLGVLRRRPDARWRIESDDVERLAQLQRTLVDAAAQLVAPGGRLIYSVCTLTNAETTDIDDEIAAAHPDLRPVAIDEPLPANGEASRLAPRPWGRGALLLPQDAGSDGMFVVVLERPA